MFPLEKNKDIVINVGKEDLERLTKDYEDNAWDILKEQIEYSNSNKDTYRLIDKKSAKRLFAKKFTSVRKINVAPVIYVNRKGFLFVTYGTILWKTRIFFSIGGKEYWKYIKDYQTITYPDGFTENCYICVENLPNTFTMSAIENLIKSKDVKGILEHTELTMMAMNEEKVTYELTGFFKSGANFLAIAAVCLIIGALFIGTPIGFLLGKLIN